MVVVNMTTKISNETLIARVYDYYQSQQTEAIDSERKSKVGTGDRAEKIRTYNYPTKQSD